MPEQPRSVWDTLSEEQKRWLQPAVAARLQSTPVDEMPQGSMLSGGYKPFTGRVEFAPNARPEDRLHEGLHAFQGWDFQPPGFGRALSPETKSDMNVRYTGNPDALTGFRELVSRPPVDQGDSWSTVAKYLGDLGTRLPDMLIAALNGGNVGTEEMYATMGQSGPAGVPFQYMDQYRDVFNPASIRSATAERVSSRDDPRAGAPTRPGDYNPNARGIQLPPPRPTPGSMFQVHTRVPKWRGDQ